MSAALIAKSSTILESVTSSVQLKKVDIDKANLYFQTILDMLQVHQKDVQNITNAVLKEAVVDNTMY